MDLPPSTQSPYTSHTSDDVESMLFDLGLKSIEDLFDIPSSVKLQDPLDIPPSSEHEVKTKLTNLFQKNLPLVEFIAVSYTHLTLPTTHYV